MARIEILILIITLTSVLNAQVTFEKSFGGFDNDLAYSVTQATDGGYIIAGYTESYGHGSADIYLFKTDHNGNISWTKTYGGKEADMAYDIQQTSDGNYIIAGTTANYSPYIFQIYLLKIDSGGDTLWTKTYDGGQAFSIQQTIDNGFIVTGYAGNISEDVYDFFLLKTDSNGNKSWKKTYGDMYKKEWAYSVKQTRDGGYIMAGFKTGDWKYYNGYIIKIDSVGEIIWKRNDYVGTFKSVLQTEDGGYLIAGYKEQVELKYYAYLLKTDSAGNSLWQKTYGMTDRAYAESVQQTMDKGYIFAGAIDLFGCSRDVYLVKTNQNGKLIWARSFGGRGDDRGYSVQQTRDGGYIVAGRNSYDTGSRNDYEFYLIKTNDKGFLTSDQDLKESPGIKIFPNPADSHINIVLSQREDLIIQIFNSAGLVIYQNEFNKKEIVLNIENYSPGIYFVMINAKNDNAFVRFIKN